MEVVCTTFKNKNTILAPLAYAPAGATQLSGMKVIRMELVRVKPVCG